jgi:hypothetical protein
MAHPRTSRWRPAWAAWGRAFGPRLWSRGWLPCCVALLAACGPGVGGSGVGPTANGLAAFGATEAPVCGGELAALLGCPPAGSVSSPVPASAPVFLADTTGGRRVAVQLQDGQIQIGAPCLPLSFRGTFGVVAGQAPRYYGFVDPDGTAALATAVAQADAGGVLLTVSDAQGRVLLGPVRLVPVAAPAAPGGCP